MRNDKLFSYARDDYQKFFYTINKKNYLFRATFINADNIAVDFQKGAIKELQLTDSIYSPFINGYIVIDNTEDVIERYVSNLTLSEFSGDSTVERGYRTRGDARDLLFLSIIPTDNTTNPYDEQSLNYNKVFSFQYVFVLSNEEDVPSDTGKLKKYTIVDLDYEILKEKKIFLSTSYLTQNDKFTFLSNKEREAKTGDILKYILQTGLGDNTSIFSTLSGNIVTTPNFEQGVSKLFYSSPVNNTALDDLNYILSLHVTNDPAKDFSLLKKDDFTGEYTLKSVSYYFSKAFDKTTDSGGEFFVENLTITGSQDTSNVVENDMKKPLVALEFGETGDVIDVKFFNTPGTAYQEKVKSMLVHSYDFESKLFAINGIEGDIENVKKTFSDFYVSPMKGKDNKPSPNLIINNTQRTNQNFDNTFLIYGEDNNFLKLAVGRNEVLKNALKLNLGVEIIVQGGFQRMAGRFISVDRKGSYVDNDFDNKFLGIYFILSVDHQFIDNEYYNKIVAVKTYHFNDPMFNQNIS